MPDSTRSRRAASARQRKLASLTRREELLDLIIAGCSHEMIAELKKISVRTVRREIARALESRPIEAPARFLALQIARFGKALHTIDAAMDEGDLRAIDPFLKVMAGLDRYHGLAARLAATDPGPEAPPPLALPRLETKSGHEIAPMALKSDELDMPQPQRVGDHADR